MLGLQAHTLPVRTVNEASPPFRPDYLEADGIGRRRWPYVAAASFVALILVAGGVTLWWLSTQFEPIRANSTALSRVRVDGGQLTRLRAWDASGSSGHFVAFDIPYRDGKWLDVGYTLRNDAPFPVVVDQIGSLVSNDSPIRQVSVSMEFSEASDLMIPFRPFTIPSHDGRFVVVRYRFSGCSLDPKAEDPVFLATQRVMFRMRIGWITIHRSEFLPLGYSIAISGNEGCNR
jgi:hypothetical protein